ncbi:MAG: polyprenyl synthetase family protein [Candidatus Saccharicenans sp.]|uniref:polyprenyl synthetase family protein n=1 Tax=Candidatus Saccharicenans sp. TaxID=2819258 RepID=UPI004049D1E1
MAREYSTLPRPNVVPGPSEIFAPVSRKLRSVDRALRSWPGRTSPVLLKMARQIASQQGKLIRPGILLLITGHFGYKGMKDTILAAAVEAIHLASLIHDDIIDGSTYRRGEKTAVHRFGPNFSLLLGDFFFIRSIARTLSSEDPEIPLMLAATAQEMIEGEMEELEESYNFSLTPNRYLKIIAKKTASLFRTTCRLGCRLSQAGKKEEAALAEYGLNLGLAFQVIDDLLDLVGQPGVTGKPAFSDLREGRVTLPLIKALKHSEPAARKEFKRQLEKISQNKAQSGVSGLLALMEKSGALRLTFEHAQALAGKARQAALALKPSVHRQCLLQLVDFVLWRKK